MSDMFFVPRRVVYVEDSEAWREVYGAALTKGLQRNGVIVEAYANFESIKRELHTKGAPLADCYIFDNEIVNEKKEGAQFAQEVALAAQEREQEVLIITMLASNPKDVEQVYGKKLKALGISSFSKLSQSPVCFQLVGASIEKGLKLDLTEWMRSEGIEMPHDNSAGDNLRSNFIRAITPGGLYLPPLVFAQQNEAKIKQYMSPEGKQEFARVYPFKRPLMEGNQRAGSPRKK